MGELILILGGARSGKSSLAQRLALDLGGERVLYLATAEALDDEMRARISAHRQERPAGWRTVEEPIHVTNALRDHVRDAKVVLLDCVTLWVTNLMLTLGVEPDDDEAEALVLDALRELLLVLGECDATLLAVSNEVGLGVVPAYPLGRLYRDLLGRVNQILASEADQVLFMIAGIGVDLRRLQACVTADSAAQPPL